MKNILSNHGILRYALALILLTHSLPSIITLDVNNFGNLYLNQIGFAPFGVALAWGIKLSHIVSAITFLSNKYVKLGAALAIFVFAAGIAILHIHEGWFVIGGGRNGAEYNFLLIICSLVLMFPKVLGAGEMK
uniref:hypothetical protein n=1 Tax=Fulvivirga sp. TaxID=1931237 RepID=UPI0040491994